MSLTRHSAGPVLPLLANGELIGTWPPTDALFSEQMVDEDPDAEMEYMSLALLHRPLDVDLTEMDPYYAGLYTGAIGMLLVGGCCLVGILWAFGYVS